MVGGVLGSAGGECEGAGEGATSCPLHSNSTTPTSVLVGVSTGGGLVGVAIVIVCRTRGGSASSEEHVGVASEAGSSSMVGVVSTISSEGSLVGVALESEVLSRAVDVSPRGGDSTSVVSLLCEESAVGTSEIAVTVGVASLSVASTVGS